MQHKHALCAQATHICVLPILGPEEAPVRVLGVLEVLSRGDGQPLKESDVELLSNIAADVGSHMQNAADLASGEQGLRLCQDVLGKTKPALRSLPFDSLLGVMGSMVQAVHGGASGAVYVCEDGQYSAGVTLRRLAVSPSGLRLPGEVFEIDEKQREQEGETPPSGVRQAMELNACLHLSSSHEWVDPAIDLLGESSASSLMCLPLYTTEGSIFGTVVVYSPSCVFLDYAEGEVRVPEGILYDGPLLQEVRGIVCDVVKNEHVHEGCRQIRDSTAPIET